MPYVIIVIWIIAFFIDFPNLVGWGCHGFDERLLYCTYDLSDSLSYSIFLAVFLVMVPFILLIFAYTQIMLFSRAVKKCLKELQKEDDIGPGCPNTKRLTDLRLLRSVLIIWITYTLLWLPYLTVMLFDQRGKWGRTTHVIRDFAFFCVWTNETSASRNLRSYLVLQRLCTEAALSPGIDAFLY